MRPLALAATAALASLATLAYAEATAHADCAAPRTAFAPATGTMLFPRQDDVVHVFVPTRLEDAVRVETIAGGRGGDVDAERVSTSDAFDVYRVEVDALDLRGADELVVRVHYRGYEEEARYPLGRAVRVRPRGGPLTLSAERVSDHWSCSYTDTWQLTPSHEADAYRVEYATTKEAISGGRASTLVVPRNTSTLFGASHGAARIDLGHVSCLGATMPESLLDGPLYVRVTALLRHTRDPVSPIYELGAAPEEIAPPPPAPPVAPTVPVHIESSPLDRGAPWLPLALAFAAALLLGTLVIARRRITR